MDAYVNQTLLFNASIWPALSPPLTKKLAHGYYQYFCVVAHRERPADGTSWWSDHEVATALRKPLLAEELSALRLGHFRRVLTNGSQQLRSLLFLNREAPDSWLGLLSKDVEWLRSSVKALLDSPPFGDDPGWWEDLARSQPKAWAVYISRAKDSSVNFRSRIAAARG